MRRGLTIAAALTFGSYGVNAAPSSYTGNRIYNHCKAVAIGDMSESNALEKGICIGTINTILGARKLLSIFPPSTANTRQALMIVVKHMENNPEELHYDLANLAILSLVEVWPCKD